MKKKLPKVSVIIIHYNRFDLLQETLNSFLYNCHYNNLEVIISDDNSKPEIKNKLIDLPADILVTNYRNKGLGKNTNNALRIATGKYILQLQDDWKFIGKKNFLKKSIAILENNEEVDIIRYYNRKIYPLLPYSQEFFEIDYENVEIQYKNTLYSDTPHLKRNTFHSNYGFFKEGVKMTEMEVEFAENYSKNRTGGILFTNQDEFLHTGYNNSFNPYQKKMKLYNKLNKYKALRIIIGLYKKLK